MTTPIPPGWYDDPEDPNAQRYWDGQSWTPHRRQKPVPQPAPPQAAYPPPYAPPLPPGQQSPWLPARRRSRTPLIIAGVVAAVLFLVVAGALAFVFVFGSKTIEPRSAAKAIADAVTQHTGFTPTDVKCPSGVDAKVGGTFHCHFTGPDGPYTAYMKITKVDGDRAEFDIKTQLNGDPPPN